MVEYLLEDKALTILQNYEKILEVKMFQRLCHVVWGIDIFEKLTPEI